MQKLLLVNLGDFEERNVCASFLSFVLFVFLFFFSFFLFLFFLEGEGIEFGGLYFFDFVFCFVTV